MKNGKLERGGSGKRASLPKELRKPTMMPKGVKREKAGIPNDPSDPLPPCTGAGAFGYSSSKAKK